MGVEIADIGQALAVVGSVVLIFAFALGLWSEL